MKKSDTIYLVTKADDLGSNDSANRAFIDAYHSGILKNGVIMMTCASAKEAAEQFRGAKGFCMGLHLTLNAEWDKVRWGPVLPPEKVPSIVDQNGHLFQTTRALHANRPVMEEILAELQAQLDLARQYGLEITFADEHMGFEWVLEGLDEEIDKWCRRNGLLHYNYSIPELPEIPAEGNPLERFIARLEAVEPGVYYIHMGHPAYDTPEMRELGHPGYPGETVATEREWDRLTMMDPQVVEYCKSKPVIPVTLTEALRLFGR